MNKHRFLIKSYGLSTKNFVTVACQGSGCVTGPHHSAKKTQCSGALRFFISAIFSDRGCFPTPTLRGGLLPARRALVITDQGCVSSSWLVDSLNIATNTTAHTFKIMLQFGFIGSFSSFNNYNSHVLSLPAAHQFLNLLRAHAVVQKGIDVTGIVPVSRGDRF